MKRTKTSPGNGELIKRLCEMDESINIEFKRASRKMVHKALEAIVAFANTEGGFLILGMEDSKKAKDPDRLFGIQENPERGTRYMRVGGGYVQQSFLSLSELADNKRSDNE